MKNPSMRWASMKLMKFFNYFLQALHGEKYPPKKLLSMVAKLIIIVTLTTVLAIERM